MSKPHVMCVQNVSVCIDSSQINSVVKLSYLHLCNLSKMKSCLTFKGPEIEIHALISSRLHYCNVLFKAINQSSISHLQKAQNSAARLLMGIKKREHITPTLVSLHWLSVYYRIDFKLLLLVYKSLHGFAPAYLSDLLIEYQTGQTLRSATWKLLKIPRTHLSQKGDFAFAVAVPKLWNSLPKHIRDTATVQDFKVQLKTHLFSIAFNQ